MGENEDFEISQGRRQNQCWNIKRSKGLQPVLCMESRKVVRIPEKKTDSADTTILKKGERKKGRKPRQRQTPKKRSMRTLSSQGAARGDQWTSRLPQHRQGTSGIPTPGSIRRTLKGKKEGERNKKDECEMWLSSWQEWKRKKDRPMVGEGLEELAKRGVELLGACGGDLKILVGRLRERWSPTRFDWETIDDHFGKKVGFTQIEQLQQVVLKGVPVCVRGKGCVEKRLEHGNHPSASRNKEALLAKVVSDVKLGRTLVFPKRMWGKIPGLQVSPVGIIQEPTKVRIIHDLSCSLEGWGPSVNDQTALEDALPVHCGTVIGDVIRRIVGLRKKFPGRGL
ncbi:unnamed protein product [Choristocarpus tenellus]